MPAIRLPEEARAADVDHDELAMTVRLTAHEIARLWRGETIDVTDAPIRKLAAMLGCDVAALLVSSVSTANDSEASAANDDRDPVYDDGPVMAAEHGAGAPSAREPVDMGALIERALAQLVANSEGRYTDEDANFVVDVLSAGELPSGLTPREVPAFLTAWIEPASELRRLGRAQPNLLLTRVIEDAPKGPAKMAAGIKAKVEQAKAPAKAPKKPANG